MLTFVWTIRKIKSLADFVVSYQSDKYRDLEYRCSTKVNITSEITCGNNYKHSKEQVQ